jgi:iron(III) transport system ATP-binding protein
VREEIRDIQRSLALTSIYVTHDQEEALAVSDRIIVMNQAVIAQEGTPNDLYEAPADLFVADFIGDANVVAAEITRIDGETARVRVGETELCLPHRGFATGPVHLAIRPEALRLSNHAEDGGLAGTVRKATYLGNHMEYRVESDIGKLFVVDPRVEAPISEGESVSISLANHGVTVVMD